MWAAASLLIVVAVHLLAIWLLSVNQREVTEGMRRVRYTGVSQSLVHIVFAGAFALTALALVRGWRWSRLIGTLLLLLQFLAHSTLPLVLAILPTFAIQIVIVQFLSLVFELTTLYLLWFPKPSRAFFRRVGTSS
jgi:hypothetical protein